LIDPDIIEKVLAYYIDNRTEFDYVSNLHPPTWPDGNDVEVMSLEVLREAWREAGQPHEREHTTPFLWDQPDRYRIGNVIWESGLDYSRTLRWTVDYIEDYRFVNTVYEMLYCNDRPVFGVERILALLDKHPWISELNNSLVGINWYRHYPGVLRTISPGSCGNSIHGHVNEHSRRLPSS
jgi:spore coat polysaccharide biosynthesis protein SpsF